MGKITLLALKVFIVNIITLASSKVPDHNFPFNGRWSFCYSEQTL